MTALVALVSVLVGFHSVAASTDAGESLQGFSYGTKDEGFQGISVTESTDFEAAALVPNRGLHTCSIEDRITKGFKNEGVCARSTTTDDAVTCARLCLNVLGRCQAINYDEESKSCCFIYQPGNTVAADEGTSTAFIRIDLVMWCNPEYFELNHSRKCGSDDDVCTEYDVTNASDCCVTCYTEPGCVQFVYDSATGKCWLQNSVSKTGNISYQGRASGLLCSEY